MIICPKCKAAMIRADHYDPNGEISISGGIRDGKGILWICVDCLRHFISASTAEIATS